MQVADDFAPARTLLGSLPRPLGFVPTMGALHAGHLSLVEAARARCASIAASVFVNPLQFAPGEDFARYPRDAESDRRALAAAGVDVLFAPSGETVYPAGFATAVEVGGPAARFEGVARPMHFRGVATVMAMLLNAVRPDVLFLGQKDAQQTAVLRRMIADLAFPVEIEIVPTVRETDGLALSSRNAYLNERERAAAPTLHRALTALRDALAAGASKRDALVRAQTTLSPLASLDYLDVVDADTFEPIDVLRPPAFVIGAARFGATRLIDNLWVRS